MYLFFVLSSIEIALSHFYLEFLLVDSFVKQCSFKLIASNHSITFFFVLIMRFRTSCLRDRSLITSRDKISQFLKCFHVLMLIYTCFYEMFLFTKIDSCFDHHFFENDNRIVFFIVCFIVDIKISAFFVQRTAWHHNSKNCINVRWNLKIFL
jgi:hypothetical protein